MPGYEAGLAKVRAVAVTTSDRDQARRVVASMATDATDAAELLRMLGLVESAPSARRRKS
ncbi:hypothetical protein [Embleya scabrispora]|nr:hypothetical protein [Embleya scabrispora]